MNKFKAGDLVRHIEESNAWLWKVIAIVPGWSRADVNGLDCVLAHDVPKTHYKKGYKSMLHPDFVNLVSPGAKKRTKQTRVDKLYLASAKDGATHKGLVNVINNRGAKSFGLTPTQAVSRYEDNHGGKILPNEDIVVWKLTPYKVRKQPNGKFRLDREVK